MSVVLASEGYPGSYEKGKVILGVEEAQGLEDVIVFHAGTALNPDGELITAGGRVLNVVALGDTFEEARNRAYEACELIKFEGVRIVPISVAARCRAVLLGSRLFIESWHPLWMPLFFYPHSLVPRFVVCVHQGKWNDLKIYLQVIAGLRHSLKYLLHKSLDV